MERGSEWIKSLKIAIINNDLEKIKQYSTREIPTFSSINEAKEALALVENAKNILMKEKNKIARQLQALKQTQNYSTKYTRNSTINWEV
jgi:hypothetical protein